LEDNLQLSRAQDVQRLNKETEGQAGRGGEQQSCPKQGRDSNVSPSEMKKRGPGDFLDEKKATEETFPSRVTMLRTKKGNFNQVQEKRGPMTRRSKYEEYTIDVRPDQAQLASSWRT